MNNLNPLFCKKYEKGIITYLSIEEQIDAILQKTKQLDQKKSLIYEQLMGELEPKGLRIINFNKLSEKERFELEKYFDHEIAPYLSANIISKQQPFPFMKNRDIYAVAQLESNKGKQKYRWSISGAFKNLSVWKKRKGKGLYFFC